MKVIFFSDVHNDTKSLEMLLSEEEGIFYCLGDSELSEEYLKKNKIISVAGNCDNNNLPLYLTLDLEGNKILLLHGHTVDVKYTLNKLYYLTKSNDCNIVIFGHTHQQLDYKNDVHFYNPGSLRDSKTYLVYEDNKFTFRKLRC